MDALILAAGLGTRLGDITKKIPKCLVPIDDTPLLGIWIEFLLHKNSKSIEHIYVNTCYLTDLVENYLSAFKSSWENRINLLREKVLLGTGGTVFANQDKFKKTFLLVHADNLSVFNLDHFIEAHSNRPKDCLITMMTFDTDSPESCGVVVLDDQDVVIEFYEKVAQPPSRKANAAIYIVEPKIFDFFDKKNPPIDFSYDVLPKLLGKIYTYHNDQYHRDIGTPQSYQQAQQDYKSFLGKFFTS